MEKLAALAVVTQQVLPGFVQETAADLERTRLDLERSRMAAEDESAQKLAHRQVILEMQDTSSELTGVLIATIERRNVLREERDNALYNLEEERAANDRMVRDAIEQRFEYDHLALCLEKAERANSERLEEQPERPVHTVPDDTEVEARRKFLKRCR